MLWWDNEYAYFIILILQAICVIHAVRTGNTNRWIWLIVFIPLIGCLIYIYSEMWDARKINRLQAGLGSMLNPAGRIRELEKQLHFSNTFNNKIALADAYLAIGETDKAIALYESSLTGAFVDNEHVLTQLAIAYFAKERFAEVLSMAKKIRHLHEFTGSQAHICYTLALEKAGNPAEAEKEFKSMNGRFANFAFRYQYGLFLKRNGRTEEAAELFSDMLEESTQLSNRERRDNSEWFRKIKEEQRSR